MTNLLKYKTIKNIADITFLAVPLIYVSGYVILTLASEQLGFWGIFAVLIYGGFVILGFSVISLIARSILLYQHPSARTRQQKLVLSLTALPFLSFLLKILLEKLFAV